jgi:hypothetical protein
MVSCHHCGTPTTNLKFCSKRCVGLASKTKFTAIKQPQSVRSDYLTNPKKCTHCDSLLPYAKRMNKFCDSKCAAHHNNDLRSENSREQQKTSLAETLEKKFRKAVDSKKNKKKAVRERRGEWCEILYSPISGKIWNSKLKPVNGWHHPLRIQSATRLSEMFNFQLGIPSAIDNIECSIKKLSFMLHEMDWTATDIQNYFNIEYSSFANFLSILGIKRRGRCKRRKRQSIDIINSYKQYRKACEFKFALAYESGILGYELFANNNYKLSDTVALHRDHMISVSYGWKNNISPDIIAHPANCQILLAKDNIKKQAKCSLTPQALEERIKNW